MMTMTTMVNPGFLGRDSRPIGQVRLRRSISDALAYLVRHVRAEGSYDYEYDPTSMSPKSGYNLLRHAGTTMELYRFVGSEFDDGAVSRAAARTWDYLFQFICPVVRSGTECACLANSDVAKLGGTALTLLALTARIAQIGSCSGDLSLANRLSRYLISQQLSDGRFVSKATVTTGASIPFESIYYAGETVLALCSAYRVTQESVYLEHAVRGARAMIEQNSERVRAGSQPADHWLMRALAELHILAPDPQWVIHLRTLANAMLLLPSQTSNVPERSHWLADGSTTAISTRIEGLLASLAVELQLKNSTGAVMHAEFIRAGLTFCLARQIRSEQGMFSDPNAQGGFVQSAINSSIRIDCVQHALGASLTFLGHLPELDELRVNDAANAPRKSRLQASRVVSPTAKEIIFAVVQERKTHSMGRDRCQGTGMSWSTHRQIIFHRAQIFVHEGPTKTEPSHDLAHLLLAVTGGLQWFPDGEPDAVRIAEYNAVLLEHLFDGIYNSVIHGSIASGAILRRSIEYARWFVEQHFAPFPLTPEEAYRQFCWGLDVKAVTRLSPVFFEQKRLERQGGYRNNQWTLNLSSTRRVAPDKDGLAFQTLVREQLGTMTS